MDGEQLPTGAEREAPREVKVISRVEKVRQVDLGRTPGTSPNPILEQNLLPDTDAPGLKMMFKLQECLGFKKQASIAFSKKKSGPRGLCSPCISTNLSAG